MCTNKNVAMSPGLICDDSRYILFWLQQELLTNKPTVFGCQNLEKTTSSYKNVLILKVKNIPVPKKKIESDSWEESMTLLNVIYNIPPIATVFGNLQCSNALMIFKQRNSQMWPCSVFGLMALWKQKSYPSQSPHHISTVTVYIINVNH